MVGRVPVAAAALLVALAGCTDGPDDSDPTNGPDGDPGVDDPPTDGPSGDGGDGTTGPAEPLPAAIHDNVTFTAEVATLAAYPFELPRAALVSADLEWDVAANDLDLVLVGPGGVPASSTQSLTTSEAFQVALPGGAYTLEVRTPMVAVADEYRLVVTFADAPA